MELYRNLRIVLSTEDKLPFLEPPIPVLPVPHPGQANPPNFIATHQAWVKAQKEIDGLMLMTMDPEIQKTLDHLCAYDMLKELKMLYVQQADQKLLETDREFHACNQEKGQSVSSYVIKMKSYINNLERLGHAMTRNLSVRLILVSLRKEYDSVVQNYNMHSMGKTVYEGLKGSRKLKSGALSLKMARKLYAHQVERAKDLLGLIHTDVCGPFKIMSRQGAYYFVTFIDDFSRYGYVYLLKHKHKVFETFKVFQNEVKNELGKTIKSLRFDRGASGSINDLEIIQDEDTHPSLDTSLNHEEHDQEIDEPQSDTKPIRRSTRTRHLTDGFCLYIDAEEHELGDLCEPANYKATLFDPESSKWLNSMNVDMQSMKDNKVWESVVLPPNGKSLVIYIRAIKILIYIIAFYDYEIWQMDVITAFLNGYLNKKTGLINLRVAYNAINARRLPLALLDFSLMTTTVVNNSSLFEKQKLTGNNFMEWYRNLRIVLTTEDKLSFLEQPIPVLPVPPQGQANPPDVVATHQASVKA
nr:zinc finger, CCHC-type [Tanacetum cinerariifolium]